MSIHLRWLTMQSAAIETSILCEANTTVIIIIIIIIIASICGGAV